MMGTDRHTQGVSVCLAVTLLEESLSARSPTAHHPGSIYAALLHLVRRPYKSRRLEAVQPGPGAQRGVPIIVRDV